LTAQYTGHFQLNTGMKSDTIMATASNLYQEMLTSWEPDIQSMLSKVQTKVQLNAASSVKQKDPDLLNLSDTLTKEVSIMDSYASGLNTIRNSIGQSGQSAALDLPVV
jgi:hypothetical protein